MSTRAKQQRPNRAGALQMIESPLVVGSPRRQRAVIVFGAFRRAWVDESTGSQVPAATGGVKLNPWLGYCEAGPDGPGIYASLGDGVVQSVATAASTRVHRLLTLAPVTTWYGTEFEVQDADAVVLTGLTRIQGLVIRGVLQRDDGVAWDYDRADGVITFAEALYGAGEDITDAAVECWIDSAVGP